MGFQVNHGGMVSKKRNPELVLQKIEGLDRDRTLNMRPIVVFKFYNTLSSAY